MVSHCTKRGQQGLGGWGLEGGVRLGGGGKKQKKTKEQQKKTMFLDSLGGGGVAKTL